MRRGVQCVPPVGGIGLEAESAGRRACTCGWPRPLGGASRRPTYANDWG